VKQSFVLTASSFHWLAFYEAHRVEIDAAIAAEQAMETPYVQPQAAPGR
jgi:hypothetical protein